MVICERHWSEDPPLVKFLGGTSRPTIPPSIFNVPLSSLPAKKFPPRPAKTEDKQLRYFLQNDAITSFDSFKPDPELQKKYQNLTISRLETKLLYQNFSECILSIVVDNNPTLCCPLTCNAFRKGKKGTTFQDTQSQQRFEILQSVQRSCALCHKL